jgi:hypothetical protein
VAPVGGGKRLPLIFMFSSIEFPNLILEGYTPRSPKSPRYNCFAWAAGDHRRWWAPNIGYYWPAGVLRSNSIEAHIHAFSTVGYVECDDAERANPPYEPGVHRIALYVLKGVPKHAATQIDARLWSSKMGNNIDLEHTLRALEGPSYGWVQKILKRTT